MTDIKNTLDGSKDVLLVNAELASLLQIVCKDIEKQLRVRVSVNVAMGILVQKCAQLIGIDQVAVLQGTKQQKASSGNVVC